MGVTVLYDPHVKEATLQTAMGRIDDAQFKALSERANAMWARIIDERKAKGIKDPDCFSVPAIHRTKNDRKTGRPIIRPFNLSPRNPGRLGLCEDLLKGDWRLATDEEIQAEADYQHERALGQMRAEVDRRAREQSRLTRSTLDAQDAVEKEMADRLRKKQAERPAVVVSEKPAAAADEKTKAARK